MTTFWIGFDLQISLNFTLIIVFQRIDLMRVFVKCLVVELIRHGTKQPSRDMREAEEIILLQNMYLRWSEGYILYETGIGKQLFRLR